MFVYLGGNTCSRQHEQDSQKYWSAKTHLNWKIKLSNPFLFSILMLETPGLKQGYSFPLLQARESACCAWRSMCSSPRGRKCRFGLIMMEGGSPLSSSALGNPYHCFKLYVLGSHEHRRQSSCLLNWEDKKQAPKPMSMHEVLSALLGWDMSYTFPTAQLNRWMFRLSWQPF